MIYSTTLQNGESISIEEKEQKEDLPPSVESSYAIWPVQHDTKPLSMKKLGNVSDYIFILRAEIPIKQGVVVRWCPS